MNPNAAVYVPGQGLRLLSVSNPPAAAAPAPAASPAPAPTPAAAPAPTPAPAAATPAPVAAAPAPAPEKKEEVKPAPEKKEEVKKPAPAPAKEEEKKEEAKEEDVVIDEKVEEDDPRDHLNLVFIGHVDAGKSTISGNILYLTGQVDERTIAKYEREAKEKNRGTWFLAYIMDTNEEERNRGKTVEVGRAHFETEKKRYTILDAPGHKNYVPNMIGGAAQADVAVLVISAKTGEFESGFDKGGQTREHAMLVKTLGVRHLVVAINKMDEPQIKWSKERYDDIVNKLSGFLKKEAQWQPKDTYFLPISGYTGLNLMKPVPKEDCPWWEGKTMVEYLDDLKLGDRGQSDALRIPVMDKYKDSGLLNIIGKVESGVVSRGQTVYAMPNKIAGKVVGVYIAEKPVNRARAGENIRISVTGIDENDVAPGFVVCGTNNLCPVVTEFIAQIVIMELLPTNPLFTAGYEAVLHIHTGVRECNVVELLREIDKKTRQPIKKKVMFVKDGGVVIAKFQVAAPICLELFDQFPQLGRFTLRDKGKTIAIGKVVKLVK